MRSKTAYNESSVRKIIAIFILLAGFINLFSGLLLSPSPFLMFLRVFIPLEIFHASHALTVISGMLLLILARGIWQRKHRAWSLSVGVVLLSIITHIFERSSIFEILLLVFLLASLVIFRKEFTVRSTKVKLWAGLKNVLLILLLLSLYMVVGFGIVQDQFTHSIDSDAAINNYEYLIAGIGADTLTPVTPQARFFKNSLADINFLAVTLAFASLFTPFIQTAEQSVEARQKIKTLLQKYGHLSISYFSLLSDKKYFFAKEYDGAVVYKISNNTAVVLGTPLCDEKNFADVIREFLVYMKSCGLRVTFYLVTDKEKNLLKMLDFSVLKIGEEALLFPTHFSLSGAEMKKVRNSVNHVKSSGVTFAWVPLTHISEKMRREIQELHANTIKQKNMRRLTFSIEFYPLPFEPNGYLALAHNSTGQLEAALSFLPYENGQKLALDMILRKPDSINGVVDTLIAESMTFFSQKNIQEVSLGLVTLASTKPDQVTPKLMQKGRTILFKHFNQFYNYRSLFMFKEKFKPEWQPRYIAYQKSAQLLQVAVAVIGVHTYIKKSKSIS